ncbi:uncharacterized protein TNCV_273761 [Trichonephila clavipes]|nr:uncharacterized protein TNCV_273761 [Trichonephila clavipes]
MLISGRQSDAIRCKGRWKFAIMLGNSQSCFHVKKYAKKGSLIRSQLYEGLQKVTVSADRRCLKLSYNFFQDIRVSMTSRKRMEVSERWRAVGRIEAGQSITHAALYLSVHHSVISRLWK